MKDARRVIGSFELPTGRGPLRATMFEGRRWVSFPTGGPGKFPSCEIDADDVSEEFARTALALGEQALGIVGVPSP